MSKLNSTGKDGNGKAKKRHDRRLAHWQSSKGEKRHQHHAPGSMNAKKAGR